MAGSLWLQDKLAAAEAKRQEILEAVRSRAGERVERVAKVGHQGCYPHSAAGRGRRGEGVLRH